MMKKLLTVLFALAFTRFAWGEYVSVSTLTSLGSTDWNGAAVYVFAGAQSSQSAINGLVTGWFADGKITQSEIAQFTSADSYFLTASVAGDAGNTSINYTNDDMAIPFTASFSESGTAYLYAAAVLVKGDDATYLESNSSGSSWNTYEQTFSITLTIDGLTANKVGVVNSTASITPTRVEQQYPWNGLVDIELDAVAGVIVELCATNAATGAALTVETLTLDGAVFTNGVSELTSASSVLVWDAATDLGEGTVVSNAILYVKLTGTSAAISSVTASDAGATFTISAEEVEEDAVEEDAVEEDAVAEAAVAEVVQYETFSLTLEELGVAGVTSAMKVKAYGLPKGVTLKKSGGTWILAGTPRETLDGETRCAYVRVTAGGVQTLHKLQFRVVPAEALGTDESEVTLACSVGIGTEDDASGVATSADGITELYQGVAYSWAITATEGARVSATGLPSGLKVKKVAGAYVLAGTPKKAGSYVAIFKTRRGSVTTITTEAFTVTALPDWAVGTFDGGGAEGLATLKVSSSGKLSGKWRSGGTNYTASATGFASHDADTDAYTATLTLKKGRTSWTTDVVFFADDVGGLGTNDLFTVRENVWRSTAEWKSLAKQIAAAGTLTVAPGTPGAADALTLRFSTRGKVTLRGTLTSSDGATAAVSGSSVLCPVDAPAEDGSFTATVTVYIAPSRKLPEGYTSTLTLLWNGSGWAGYEVE